MDGQDPRRALDRLYRAHHARLVRGLQRGLAQADEAEEIAQEAYLRCLAHRPPENAPVRAWLAYLFRVARNIAIDRRRHAALKREKLALVSEMDETAAPRAPARPGVQGPVPLTVVEPAAERIVDARSTLRALAAAINELEPKTRQAFIWHRFHGMSYAEIARRLGVSVSSVEKYIMTALLACRRARAEMRIAGPARGGADARARPSFEMELTLAGMRPADSPGARAGAVRKEARSSSRQKRKRGSAARGLYPREGGPDAGSE